MQFKDLAIGAKFKVKNNPYAYRKMREVRTGSGHAVNGVTTEVVLVPLYKGGAAGGQVFLYFSPEEEVF